jgi:hypothetical protein
LGARDLRRAEIETSTSDCAQSKHTILTPRLSLGADVIFDSCLVNYELCTAHRTRSLCAARTQHALMSVASRVINFIRAPTLALVAQKVINARSFYGNFLKIHLAAARNYRRGLIQPPQVDWTRLPGCEFTLKTLSWRRRSFG